ncbi:unnamed protein product [Caenorhabditis angaria]|uniref:GRIP domain-containing protein n=1 Tax=Caenorhabditis angaria TaxID=860376 RepID=A0A9P1MYM4_9PELO|nr:unnamed protein product [Caenorhabditis angaria]
MAEPSKRADIALLLASILEYPKEEMEKFRSAVKQSFGPSFFASNSPNQKSSSTLTEQFIRFLEVESESSKTAGNLPLRQKTEPPLKISMDSSAPQTSSSSANLDSLLR